MQAFKGKWFALALWSGCAAMLPGAAWPLEAPAAENPAASSPLHGWIAVDNARLEEMRGGFDIAPGLRVSFGIERIINLNGSLQTAIRLEVPDAGKLIESGQMPVTGNGISPGLLTQAVGASFIQNSASNQTIQSVTIIDTTTNSMELLKGVNLQSTLLDAITQGLGSR